MLVLEVHRVAEAFTVGGLDVTLGTAVLRPGIEVPSVNGVEQPGSSGVSFLRDLGFAAHACKQHFVVVKGAIQVSIGRDHWGGIELPHEVKHDLLLGEQFVP